VTDAYICVLQLVKELEMKTLMRGYETKMRGYAMKSRESVSASQGDTDLEISAVLCLLVYL